MMSTTALMRGKPGNQRRRSSASPIRDSAPDLPSAL